MAGSYKSIVRDYQRRFPRHVRLQNAFWWRIYHVKHQLRHLTRDDYASWSEGDQALGNYFGIWGFRCAAQAGCLEGWAADCGIDWSITPEHQADRPPMPPERGYPPPSPALSSNLRSVFHAAALGVSCRSCGRRVALEPSALGAHDGDMRDISSLPLRCKACGSRDWTHQVLRTVQHAAEFMAGAS